jgi:hypothetical protein
MGFREGITKLMLMKTMAEHKTTRQGQDIGTHGGLGGNV